MKRQKNSVAATFSFLLEFPSFVFFRISDISFHPQQGENVVSLHFVSVVELFESIGVRCDGKATNNKKKKEKIPAGVSKIRCLFCLIKGRPA